jgi:Cu+-exporting ATPase
MAASRGILMRSGEAFQVFGDVDVAVLDKTGTLTAGKPTVVQLVPVDGVSVDELLSLAAAAEMFSEHPLARAVVAAAEQRELYLSETSEFAAEAGQGVRVTIDGSVVSVGKPSWVVPADPVTGVAERQAAMEQAQTVAGVARDSKLLGLIGIADAIKPDAAEAVARLRAAGIRPVMVTGDNAATARAVAAQVGIDEVRAQVLPGEKAEVIRRLQQDGHRVLMVGDGINDAPALTQADIGIAMGAGTDIAIESADVVLVGERLSAVADARDIGAASFKKTKQNLAVAFSFNGIGVPLTVAGVIGPVWAMVAMITSVSVVLANSFAARLSGGLAADIARFLGRAALGTLGMLRPSHLRRWAAGPRAAGLVGLLAAGFALGAIWVVALGAPVPGL